MHLYINQSRLHSNLQATYYIAFTELKTENDYSSWQAWSNQWPSRRYQRHSRTWIRRSQPASLFSNSTPLIQCSPLEKFLISEIQKKISRLLLGILKDSTRDSFYENTLMVTWVSNNIPQHTFQHKWLKTRCYNNGDQKPNNTNHPYKLILTWRTEYMQINKLHKLDIATESGFILLGRKILVSNEPWKMRRLQANSTTWQRNVDICWRVPIIWHWI